MDPYASSALRRCSLIPHLLAGLLLITTGGCSGDPPERSAPLTEQTAGAVLFGGADASASDRPDLPQAAHELALLSTNLASESDWVTLFRVDSSVREFWSAPAPESTDRFTDELVEWLEELSRNPGTRSDQFWETIATRAGGCQGMVAVIYFSDGYDELVDAAGHARIRAAADYLAKNDHVCYVAVVGANPQNWAHIRDDLKPLSAVLRLCTSDEFDPDEAPRELHSAR